MAEIDKKRCRVEIDVGVFLENYKTVKECFPPDCRLMAVMKGNAYGHGAAFLAKQLKDYPDDWIGVATLGEALEIREAGVSKEILILGHTFPEDVKMLAKWNLTQAVISYPYAKELNEMAKKEKVSVKCHLAVDTGMSRIGLLGYGDALEESLVQAEEIYRMDSLKTGGIFTHFSSAYNIGQADRDYTKMQYERFFSFCEELKNRGIEVGLRHCNNSPAIVNYPEYAMDMCRGGTLLFGFLDKSDMLRKVTLKNVMTFRTVVTMIKEIEPGTAISYGRTAVAKEKMRLAVLGVGWYDGYPRQLGNIGKVLIRGRKFSIVGRVCMDICMADITEAEDIKAGDDVVLLGRQEDAEITVGQLFKPIGLGAGSIGGGITARVPRVYLKEGQMIEVI